MRPRTRRSSARAVLCLAIVLMVLCPAASSQESDAPESQPELRERGTVRGQEALDLVSAGKYEEALAALRQAILLFTQGDDPDTAGRLRYWVAFCFEGLGRLEEAVTEYEVVLGAWIAAPDIEAADVLVVRGRLAEVLYALGRFEQALPHFEACLTGIDEFFGEALEEKASFLCHFADCRMSLGRYEEALALYQVVLLELRRRHPEPHPTVLEALDRVAGARRALHRFPEAMAILEETVELVRELYGAKSLEHGDRLMSVASIEFGDGRYAAALEGYDQALAVYRSLIPGDDARVASCLCYRGECCWRIGALEDSLADLEESLAMCERLYRGDHDRTAWSLNALARCLTSLGRWDEAVSRFEASLEMRESLHPGDHNSVAVARHDLAWCLLAMRRPEEALPLFESSEEMTLRLDPGDSINRVRGLNTLGDCLERLGRGAEALPKHEAALAMVRRLYEGDHHDTACCLGYLASCLLRLGRFEEACARTEESLAMYERIYGPDHPAVCGMLHDLALCLAYLGKFPEAAEAIDRAVVRGRRVGTTGVHASLTLKAGLLLRMGGSPAEAAARDAEAIAQIEELRRTNSGLDAEARGRLFEGWKGHGAYDGMVYAQIALDRPAEALRYLELGRARNLLDLLERSRFDPLVEAERRARQRGDEAGIEEIRLLSEALEAGEREVARLTHSLAAARGRSGLGEAEKRTLVDGLVEELNRARERQKRAVRTRLRVLREQVPDADPEGPEEIQRLLGEGERMLVYSVTFSGGCLLLVPPPGGEIRAFCLAWPGNLPVTPDRVAAAVDSYLDAVMVDGRRARGLGVDAVESPAGEPRAGEVLFRALVPPEVWKEIRGAGRIYLVPHGALHRLPFEALVVREEEGKRTYWLDEGPQIVYGSSGSALLWSRRRREEQIRSGPAKQVVTVGDPVFSRRESESDGAGLPEKGVLVLEVKRDTPAALAGLTAGDVILGYDGAEVPDHKALRAAIYDVETAIEDGERPASDVELRIWRAGQERVLKVPPGKLGADVSKVPPRRMWDAFREGVADHRRLSVERSGLLTRYGGLEPLPGTRREVESIRASLGKAFEVSVLLGEDATKTRLYALAPRARFLHLATHQLADETEDASYSSLALTLPPVPTLRDDGFLKLIDLLLHWRDRISGCELVVLSACETQVGNVQRDEGVFALPWGFQYAGSPSVIASLWRVDDQSTADLMSGFYARLVEKEGGRVPDKLEAFNEARKALRAVRPEPYFWAPFVYIGDPR